MMIVQVILAHLHRNLYILSEGIFVTCNVYTLCECTHLAISVYIILTMIIKNLIIIASLRAPPILYAFRRF